MFAAAVPAAHAAKGAPYKGKTTGGHRITFSYAKPIGTFSIYSCLGNMRFSAKPSR